MVLGIFLFDTVAWMRLITTSVRLNCHRIYVLRKMLATRILCRLRSCDSMWNWTFFCLEFSEVQMNGWAERIQPGAEWFSGFGGEGGKRVSRLLTSLQPDFVNFSNIFMNFHWFSLNFRNFHEFSLTLWNFRGSSSIPVNLCKFAWVFVDLHEFSSTNSGICKPPHRLRLRWKKNSAYFHHFQIENM